jgi:hypothetical protein
MLLMRVNAQEIHAIKRNCLSFFIERSHQIHWSLKNSLYLYFYMEEVCQTNLDRVKRYGVLYGHQQRAGGAGIIVAP